MAKPSRDRYHPSPRAMPHEGLTMPSWRNGATRFFANPYFRLRASLIKRFFCCHKCSSNPTGNWCGNSKRFTPA